MIDWKEVNAIVEKAPREKIIPRILARMLEDRRRHYELMGVRDPLALATVDMAYAEREGPAARLFGRPVLLVERAERECLACGLQHGDELQHSNYLLQVMLRKKKLREEAAELAIKEAW